MTPIKIYRIERQNKILQVLEKNGRIDTADLASNLQVSKETIRKDIKTLEQQSLLRRTHGGAVQISDKEKNREVSSFDIRGRMDINPMEKDKICRLAAKQIKDGDVVFIDNSSTNIKLIRYIDPSYSVVIITNSVRILLEAEKIEFSNFTIIMIGGIYRKNYLTCVGEFARDMSKKLHPNKAFVSCYGIDSAGTMYDMSFYELEVKIMMMKSAEVVYLDIDHTKFGKIGGTALGTLESIDFIITDDDSEENYTRLCRRNDKQLLVVDNGRD